MFNFIPKQTAPVTLLFGKTSLQRCRVGHGKHLIEIPVDIINPLYCFIDKTKSYYKNYYNPLTWGVFLNLKLKAYYLCKAFESKSISTSLLGSLSLITKLYVLYKARVNLIRAEALYKCFASHPYIKFPMQEQQISLAK